MPPLLLILLSLCPRDGRIAPPCRGSPTPEGGVELSAALRGLFDEEKRVELGALQARVDNLDRMLAERDLFWDAQDLSSALAVQFYRNISVSFSGPKLWPNASSSSPTARETTQLCCARSGTCVPTRV